MINLKDWDLEKLKSNVKELHESIYNIDCYSVSDLFFYDELLKELDRRNIVFSVNQTLEFESGE